MMKRNRFYLLMTVLCLFLGGCASQRTTPRSFVRDVPFVAKSAPTRHYHPPLKNISLRTMYSGVNRSTHKHKSTFGHGVRSNGKRDHMGIDLVAPIGTPLYAMYDGVIEEVRRIDPYNRQRKTGAHGKRIMIRSKEVFLGYDVVFVYAHLSDIPIYLQDGDSVQAGELIAYAGISGNARFIRGMAQHAEEQHVHLECRVDEDLSYLVEPGRAMRKDFSDETVFYIDPFLVLL